MLLPLLIALVGTPSPTTPTTSADPHSLANFEVVAPRHVALDLTLDFERHRMHGSAELTLDYRKPAAATVLDLDTRDLTVALVTDVADGHPYRFELGPEVEFLGRRLRIHLGTRRPARLRIAYDTAPDASALQWLGPAQTTSGKLPFLFSQSQAIHARSWIPLADSPGVRVTYDAVIRAPKGVSVVMSAERLSADEAKGVYRFKMPQSIPSYLIAIAAGEIAFKPIGARTGVYAEPAVLERAAYEFADMEKMLEAGERLVGPYRWERWDAIVLPPSFPYGGMENPRLTFATPTLLAGDRSLTNVMAHELAHSWSGNLVTNSTWGDIWLNEGFTTYLENRIDGELYGADFAQMYQLLSQRQLRATVERVMRERPKGSILALDLAGRDPDEGLALAYDKGSSFLYVLEQQFGRARFDAFLRDYFDQNAFGFTSSKSLVERLKRDLFKGDAALWQQLKVDEWIFGQGLPDNLVVPVSDRFAAVARVASDFVASGALEAVGSREGKPWATAEWLEFLGGLPRNVSRERLVALDQRSAVTQSGNSEILFAWLKVCVRNSYEPAYPALESFLTRQGRGKYLRPLYEALQENPTTRELAVKIYTKARPGYHPIAADAVDRIMKRGVDVAN